MGVIALIPARCGSKGFKDKNIVKIKGKTLIELAVNIAKNSDIIDEVYISTDCKKYEDIALKAGAKSFGLRDKKLATDNAKSIDVVIDFLNKFENKPKYLLLLQPTSPLRTSDDIKKAFDVLQTADSVVSVTEFDEPHPYKLKIIDNNKLKPFIKNTTSEIPRQQLPKVYALNGAIYFIKTELLLKEKTFFLENTKPYIMPQPLINIDSEWDYLFLKALVDTNKIKLEGIK
jgi:CMP-N,N'-diacetyllegionaminic acid synthase